ncbi:uncharacterized protein LOC110814599 [Carica papaya]|uniref:uncharacterized protein LOC110814599 n=1 Tax=Carica papaya TaxID=3649 RepID=UPI000B8CEEAF|nr:uncharacterized protein LOC110814599 [Carica papaya]
MAALAVSVYSSPSSSLKPSLSSLKISPFSRLSFCNRNETAFTVQSLSLKLNHNFLGFSDKIPRILRDRKSRFCLNCKKGESNNGIGDEIDETERLARGESTMPDRFRYLTKEAPDPPVRWPWFVASAFLVYAWRAVLFELSNWRKAALASVRFVGYLLKLGVALIFHFIGDPVTSVIRCIETATYTVRASYSWIVAYAPIPELTTIIMLASAVLAIGEAAVPNSVSSQSYLLTISGLIGYAAVRSYISELFFWTLLVGLYSFSRLVKKRDDVTSALPVAAVLVAVGEPWVRFLVMASYLALAIFHHSKKPLEQKEEVEVLMTGRRVPVPLLFAALAIGIRVAAKWAGYRHLTWMIV